MLTRTNAVLREYAEEIARCEEARKRLTEEIKENYDMAKRDGFTVSALRKAIKIHGMDADRRQKHDDEQGDIEVYLANLEGRTPE